MNKERYNGWKNYETWNVALWIGNDEGLYNVARGCGDYAAFVEVIKDCIDKTDPDYGGNFYGTPDGVSWNDSGLDIDALDDLVAEL